jgi:hypothetical protein
MADVMGVDASSKSTLRDFNQANENATYSEAYFQYVINPTLVDYRSLSRLGISYHSLRLMPVHM